MVSSNNEPTVAMVVKSPEEHRREQRRAYLSGVYNGITIAVLIAALVLLGLALLRADGQMRARGDRAESDQWSARIDAAEGHGTVLIAPWAVQQVDGSVKVGTPATLAFDLPSGRGDTLLWLAVMRAPDPTAYDAVVIPVGDPLTAVYVLPVLEAPVNINGRLGRFADGPPTSTTCPSGYTLYPVYYSLFFQPADELPGDYWSARIACFGQ